MVSKGTSETFCFGKERLTAGLALAICAGKKQGIINKEVSEKVLESQRVVEAIVASKQVVYGINTGFGPLCSTLISKEDTNTLQYNILKSHSVGVGESVPKEIVKLMLVLKVHALAQGYSGIRIETLERIIWHINNDVIPLVPSQGSVGASGDLAPLAHLFLPLIGLGKVSYKGKEISTEELFQKESLKPIALGPKEGLALINGTQFIAAYGIKAVEKLHNCLENADIIAAMMIDGLLGSSKPFMEELHQLRPHKGNQYVASRIRNMLKGSEILKSHQYCSRVQDPYSLRCVPQVHGASRNAWLHLKETLEIELNSVTDNPVIFNESLTISGGNFHGQPMALPLDYATLAASEIGNISDRRVYLALERESEGLPKLLMNDTGINSGFMILQYTSAALASENKGLTFPASADSIPTSMGQEDHVSMGSISGRKALQVIENVENILAIELLCAAQAFDFRRPLASSKLLGVCYEHIRSKIDHAKEDRIFSDDIALARQIVVNKELTNVLDQYDQNNVLNQKNTHYELFGVY